MLKMYLYFIAELSEAAEESRFDQNMSLHPYFDFDVPRNVTARVGQTAFLHCRVEQLGDKSVSTCFFFLKNIINQFNKNNKMFFFKTI